MKNFLIIKRKETTEMIKLDEIKYYRIFDYGFINIFALDTDFTLASKGFIKNVIRGMDRKTQSKEIKDNIKKIVKNYDEVLITLKEYFEPTEAEEKEIKNTDNKKIVKMNRTDFKKLYDFFEDNHIEIDTGKGKVFNKDIYFGYLQGIRLSVDLDMLDEFSIKKFINILNFLIISNHKIEYIE
jgi:hypothetical protein